MVRSACLVLLLALPITAQQNPSPDERKLSTLAGRTINAVTGEPIRKVALTLHLRQSGSSASAATADSDGRFLFENLEPGTYTLSGQKGGFLPGSYGTGSPKNSMILVTLAPGQHMKDVEFRMTPQGLITGKVLDEDGEPLPEQASVGVMRQDRGARHMMFSGQMTNEIGDYRIAGLSPGRYYVIAHSGSGGGHSQSRKDSPEDALVPTFYPGALDAASAVPIEVRAGQEVTGINVTLRKARVYRVEGRIAGLAPARSANRIRLTIRARERKDEMWLSGTGGRAKPDGSFEITQVQPGAYELSAFDPTAGIPQVLGRVPIDVTDANLRGVVVPLLEPLTVSGTVRVDGDTKFSLDGVRVVPRPIESDLFGAYPVAVSRDGTFKIDSISPDRYNLSLLGLPETAYFKSARFGKLDVLESGLDLTEAQGAVTLELTIGTKPGAVEGTVQEEAKPVPGSTVMLVPDPIHPGLRFLLKFATADQNGRFTIRGVGPGKYSLYAWRDAPEIDWSSDPDAFKSIESKAVKVTVEESATTHADLTPISPQQQ